jgi:putative ABC transport system substrate-binding protein
MAQLLPQMQDAARALGLVVSSLGIQRVDELEGAFARAAEHQEESILALADYPSRNIGDVPTLALRHGLPTMFLESESARAGGLMSYGPNVPAEHRRAAYYVDRILKGAQPAELPVEQPREFDFVINLKTAEAVGLTIPQHVLIQATEVIQ